MMGDRLFSSYFPPLEFSALSALSAFTATEYAVLTD